MAHISRQLAKQTAEPIVHVLFVKVNLKTEKGNHIHRQTGSDTEQTVEAGQWQDHMTPDGWSL